MRSPHVLLAIAVALAAVPAEAAPALGTLVSPAEPKSRAKVTGAASAKRATMAVLEGNKVVTLWRDGTAVARIATPRGHGGIGEATDLAFSPDGSVVAITFVRGPILLVSADDGARLGMLGSHMARRATWVDDRHVVVEDEGNVSVIDLEVPDRAAMIGAADAVTWNAGGGRLVAAVDGRVLVVEGAAAARPIGAGTFANVTADGKRAVWEDGDKTIVYDLTGKRVERTLVGALRGLGADRIAVGSGDDTVVRALSTGAEVGAYRGGSFVELLDKHVVAIDKDRLVIRPLAAGGKPSVDRALPNAQARAVGPDTVVAWGGNELVVVRSDGTTLRSHPSPNGIEVVALGGGTGTAAAAHARAGALGRADGIAAATRDRAAPRAYFSAQHGRVGIADLTRNTVVAEPSLVRGRVHAIAVSRDGRWLAAGGDDEALSIVDLWSGATRAVPTSEVNALAFDPAGARLAVGSTNGVRIVSVPDGVVRETFPEASLAGAVPTWSGDGTWLAWTTGQRTCTWTKGTPDCTRATQQPSLEVAHFGRALYRVTSGASPTEIEVSSRAIGAGGAYTRAFAFESSHYVHTVELSPSGAQLLFSGSKDDGSAHVTARALSDGKPQWARELVPARSTAFYGPVAHSAYTARGDRIVVTAGDHLEVLDAANGKLVATIAARSAFPAVAAR